MLDFLNSLLYSPSEPKFGHSFKSSHFSLIDKDVLSVNHGSYGNVPTVVFEKYIENTKREYNFPDRFILTEQKNEYMEALDAVATKYLHCDFHNLAFIPNATTGVNTVLRSLKFEKGDKILFFSTVYGACYNTIKFLESSVGIVPIVIDLNEYPWEDKQILDKFSAAIAANGPIKLALFDAVTLMPGVRMPFENLVKICKENDIISLVDGAHSIGLIKLNMTETAPDFFVTNLHKWLFVPRGCAVMYVDPRFHGEIQTLPVSHSYVDQSVVKPNNMTLIDKFYFIGTKNFAAIATVKEAIKFREEVCGGEEAIAEYCTNLSKAAIENHQKKWPFMKFINNSNLLILVPSMVNLVISIDDLCKHYDIEFPSIDFSNKAQVLNFHDFVDELLLKEYKARVPFDIKPDGHIWMRFSCQLYNEASDYDFATDSLVKGVKRFVEELKH